MGLDQVIYTQLERTALFDNSVFSLSNESGMTLLEGSVCVVETMVDEAFTTTVVAGRADVKVLLNRTVDGANGYLVAAGAVKVLVTGAVARGDRLVTSSTAGRAASNGTAGTGFAVAITENASGDGDVIAILEQNVQVTSINIDNDYKIITSVLTLSSSYQDVPGLSMSLGAGTWLISCNLDARTVGVGTVLSELSKGGVAENLLCVAKGEDVWVPATQTWRVSLSSAATVKIRSKQTVGTGAKVESHSSFSAVKVG